MARDRALETAELAILPSGDNGGVDWLVLDVDSDIPVRSVAPSLHPSLAALMPSWQARDLAIVQGLGYGECTQQHYRDIETAFTACDGLEFSREGWITRALAGRAHADAVADAVAFNVLDIRLADPMGPFRGDKLGVVQVYWAEDLLRIPVPTFGASLAFGGSFATTGGNNMLLGDLAKVIDGHAEQRQIAHFNGAPAVLIDINRTVTSDEISSTIDCHHQRQ